MTAPAPEAQVVSKTADGRERVHFAGLLRDAKQYVEYNFPRVHVEPGSNTTGRADVFIRTEHGNVVFNGADSGGEAGWHVADADGNAQVDDSAEQEVVQ